MRLQNTNCVTKVVVLLSLAWLGVANCAIAAFTLTGTVAELEGRGINAGFELPLLTHNDAETNSAATDDIGPGWTFRNISGTTGDVGVQDPAIAFYGQLAGATELPAPFERAQIGYFNMDAFSIGEVISNPVGRLQASQSYTLTVSVGGRNNLTWNDIAYRVGLRSSDGTDLGTFALATVNPGGSAAIPQAVTIQEMVYTLNSSSVPAAVGKDVQIVIGAMNTGLLDDAVSIAFSQANFDNVRLSGTFDDLLASPAASLTINRDTGNISLSNPGVSNLSIQSYSLTSTAGSFAPGSWSSIANTYDKASAPTPGNGSVDSDNAWTVLSQAGSTTDLSEAELEATGVQGGTLSNVTPINLGNAWQKTPLQDVAGQLVLVGGTTIPIAVSYTGTAIPSGDLNGSGTINGADWTLFKAGQGTSFAGLTRVQGYLKGDLDGDNDHDLKDFALFREAYLAANPGLGAGAFEAMVAGVPEPGSVILLAAGSIVGALGLRRRRLQSGAAFLVAAMFVANVASATVTTDRLYLFGESGALPQTLENGVDGQDVGSGAGNPLPGATLDHVGPSGSFQGLQAFSGPGGTFVGALPVYENVSSTGPLAQARPGSTAGGLGILFDGVDDYLSGFALNFPSVTRSTIRGGGTGTLNYDGLYQRGMQLWVYPQAGQAAAQHIVSDTTEHGIRITAAGRWAMQYDDNEVAAPASIAEGAVVNDQWSHVMVVMPNKPATPTGAYTSVMYVNGLAVSAQNGNYDRSAATQAEALVVGANTNATPANVGNANWFKGVVDELEMFTMGLSYDAITGTFTDHGTFNLLSDNDWMAANRSQVPGDISNNGSRGQEDVNAMVAGWLKTKTVNNIRVGDKDTYAQGDLNFDGITNLADVQIMVGLIGGSGSGSGIDVSPLLALGVPEPSSVLLAIAALGCGAAIARRGGRRRIC